MEQHAGDARSDLDLVDVIRTADQAAGSVAAGELFRRHHKGALGFAIKLAGESLAPDLVAECFIKVLAVIRRGQGPEDSFRPYLLSTIRRAHIDHLRRNRHELVVEDVAEVAATHADATLTSDQADERAESATILRAFRSLPERWRTVLWHSTVEGESLEDVGRILGMNANAVAALNFRAREGLRRAYLLTHLATVESPRCRAALEAMPGYVRGSLTGKRADAVATHVAQCPSCAAALSDLASINSNLGALLAPALLGGALPQRVISQFMHPSPDPARRSQTWAATAGIVAAVALTLALTVWVVSQTTNDTPAPVASPTLPLFTTSTLPTIANPSPSPAPQRIRTSRARPTHTVNVSATPPPSPSAEPSTQTSTPDTTSPSASPQTTPSPRTPVDLGLTNPSAEELASIEATWFHVELPPDIPRTDAETDVVVRLQLRGVSQYRIHVDHAYGNWQCSQTAHDPGIDFALTCSFAPEAGRSNVLALDLVPHGSFAAVRARIASTSTPDPDLSNNTAAIRISADV